MVLVVCSWLGGNGCDKPPAAPPPETPAAEPAAAPDAIPASAEDVEDTDGDEPEAAAEPAEPEALTGHAAFQIAEAAATETMGAREFLLTPALPPTWPVPEGSPAVVVYYMYPLEPFEVGVMRYRLGRAAVKVTLTLADRTAAVEELPTKGKPLGTVELGRGETATDDIHGAEEALFAVMAGTKTADKAAYTLKRYDKWLEKNELVAKDLRSRLPAFVEFVQP
jgi:hypothetical protein